MNLVLNLAALAGGLVALGAISHFTWKAFRAINEVADSIPILLRMADEFKPNHGSSMRDSLNRIESRLDDHNGRLSALEGKAA